MDYLSLLDNKLLLQTSKYIEGVYINNLLKLVQSEIAKQIVYERCCTGKPAPNFFQCSNIFLQCGNIFDSKCIYMIACNNLYIGDTLIAKNHNITTHLRLEKCKDCNNKNIMAIDIICDDHCCYRVALQCTICYS